MKSIMAFLMIAGMGMTAFAGQDKIDVANIDTNVRLEMMKSRAAKPDVTEKYEYYEIKGDNAGELRREMSRNGIKWDDGKTYDALTTWNVKWDYEYKRTEKGCSTDSFKTTVDIIFRYPKWVQTDSAPETLLTKWNSYMNNLIAHENGHRDMAVQQAADFAHAVAERSAPSCAELDREVDALGHEQMAKLNADEKDYDTTTIHGTTQGAVFP